VNLALQGTLARHGQLVVLPTQVGQSLQTLNLAKRREFIGEREGE